ncbi:MAG: hypothetical protein K8R85_16885, partial [Bacteroidetes bacterium]|nr:hypothetical protein [Bacteroidota bacterium]
SFKVGMLLSNFAWRAEGIRCILSGTKPLITKETIQSGHRISLFSNEKIKKLFPDYKFISVEQAVKDTCKLYLRDNAPMATASL